MTDPQFNLADIRYAILGTAVTAFMEHIPLNKTSFVLEAGAGSGKLGTSIAVHYGSNVTLLDIDEGYLLNAERLVHAVESILMKRIAVSLIKGDFNALEFRDDMFDLVFSEGCIEHFPIDDVRRLKCIQEMVRVSRDWVAIITNDAEGERTRKRAEETHHTYESMPEKETPYTREELFKNMLQAGLHSVAVTKYEDPGTQEYLLGVARKREELPQEYVKAPWTVRKQ